MTLKIDLNCDMGESFGVWKLGNDEAILPFVSSANIACGFHGGDPATMRKTVAAALKQGVALGAHPGLPDLQGFGRRNMAITDQEAYDMMVVQIGALAAVAASQGVRLRHVKAHGQLYNMAVKDEGLARALAQATYDVDRELVGEQHLLAEPDAKDRQYQRDVVPVDPVAQFVGELRAQFSKARLVAGDPEFDNWVSQVVAFVDDPHLGLDLPLDIRGTAFQRRVWQALRAIPVGETRTYTDIAEALGMPKAVRAVAGACASNAVAVAIPCHRVHRIGGALAGYRWGIERKRALLEKEK